MKHPRIGSGNSGFSLVGVMVIGTVVIIGVLLLAQMTLNSRFLEFRLDRRAKGEQFLVDAAAQFQFSPFVELYDLCKTKGAFTADVQGLCLKNGALNTTSETEPDPNDPKRFLELRRNWNGDVASDGVVCVELTRCNLLAEGHIIHAVLTGYWPDPRPNVPPVMRRFEFRKARW